MDVYHLYSCDQWKSTSSMRHIAVTDDPLILCALVARELSEENMDYCGSTGVGGFALLYVDYRSNNINWDRLDFGMVTEEELQSADDPSLRPFLAGLVTDGGGERHVKDGKHHT